MWVRWWGFFLRRGSRIRSLCDGGEDCVSCVFLFLVLRQQHKKKLSQGGERSEATSASEMVPSMVRCSCILFGIALGLVVLKFFFRREPSLKCPKMAPAPPRNAFKGEGSLTFTSPLKIPLCGGVLFGGGVVHRRIGVGTVVGFYFATW